MKLWMGLTLLAVGGALTAIGFALTGLEPLAALVLSTVGGIVLAGGVWEVLMVSARTYDESVIEDIPKIRP